MKHVAGHVTISDSMLAEAKAVDAKIRELEWIAWNYEKASPEQRAWYDSWQPVPEDEYEVY